MCYRRSKPDVLPCDEILDVIKAGKVYYLSNPDYDDDASIGSNDPTEDHYILAIRLKLEDYSDDLHNKEFVTISMKKSVNDPMEVIRYNEHEVVLKDCNGNKAKIVYNGDDDGNSGGNNSNGNHDHDNSGDGGKSQESPRNGKVFFLMDGESYHLK